MQLPWRPVYGLPVTFFAAAKSRYQHLTCYSPYQAERHVNECIQCSRGDLWDQVLHFRQHFGFQVPDPVMIPPGGIHAVHGRHPDGEIVYRTCFPGCTAVDQEKSEFLSTLCRFLLNTVSSWQSIRNGDQIVPVKAGQSERFFHSVKNE